MDFCCELLLYRPTIPVFITPKGGLASWLEVMLSPDSFAARYGPAGTPTPHGVLRSPVNQIPYVHHVDREIYQGLNFVVKVGMLHEMLIELSCYSTYRHPGIVQLYGWTLGEDGRIRLALESGTPLDQNSRLNSSELHILISDLISVCSFLHTSSRPLVHGDIKPENLVRIDNHYKLIDFGNAINGYFDAGQIQYYGMAYTESYRAAEYDPLVPHTARVETFSVGKTVAKLGSGQRLDPQVRLFIENTTKVASKDRVQIVDLPIYGVRFPELQGVRCGLCLPSLHSSVSSSDPESKILWYKCVSELIKQSQPLEVSLRTFFLALSNCRRCLTVITKVSGNIELYSMAHLAMALSLVQGERLSESIESQHESSIASSYREVLRVLLTHLKGQVYVSTYWDVVDDESLDAGLIQEMSYVRHSWTTGPGNARHRIYSPLQPHMQALSRRHQLDLLHYQSIQELCERPLSLTDSSDVPPSQMIGSTSRNDKS